MNDLAVIIPVYNDQRGLDASLASIQESINTFTIVVVDDGSVTPVMLDTSRFRFNVVVLRQLFNGGIICALNAGLDYVIKQGFRLVARMDAADLNRPGRLMRQYQYLAMHKDIFLVGSNAEYRSEITNKVLFVTSLPLHSHKIRKWMVFRNCFIHPTVMFRTACLAAAGHFNADYPHIEDFVFFTRIVENFTTANIQETLVECYVREDGISILYEREQLLSGIRYSWARKKPMNPLWYAYIIKRLVYLALPRSVRIHLKKFTRFVK